MFRAVFAVVTIRKEESGEPSVTTNDLSSADCVSVAEKVTVFVTSKRGLKRSVIRAPSRNPTFWLTRMVPSRSENLVGIEMLAMGLSVTVWAWSEVAESEIASRSVNDPVVP